MKPQNRKGRIKFIIIKSTLFDTWDNRLDWNIPDYSSVSVCDNNKEGDRYLNIISWNDDKAPEYEREFIIIKAKSIDTWVNWMY